VGFKRTAFTTDHAARAYILDSPVQSNLTPHSSCKMAKRSREDFEPSSPDSSETSTDSEISGNLESNVRLVIHPSVSAQPCANSSKIVHLDTASGVAQQAPPAMLCSLPPHRQTLSFLSYEAYEVHYLQTHTNRCTECSKNLPTNVTTTSSILLYEGTHLYSEALPEPPSRRKSFFHCQCEEGKRRKNCKHELLFFLMFAYKLANVICSS
jgi:hypothetical protein